MKDNLLIVFAKNTASGIIKSRLANSVGREKARKIYIELSRRIKKTCSSLTCCAVEVHYYPAVQQSDIWNTSTFVKYRQLGDDLGQRMYHAIKNGLERGYKKTCLIGTDIYGLTAENIESAFNSLDRNDVVFGPARDGGYYLVGMKRQEEDLFQGIAWSADKTLHQSIERAHALGIDVGLLPTLLDVDTLEDVYDTDLIDLLND